MTPPEERIENAIHELMDLGSFDGDHHKQYALDQTLRILTDCPIVELTSRYNPEIKYQGYGESDEYKRIVAEFCDGEDGPDTYSWEEGIAP